jgi:hypothetical protein
MNFVFNDCFQPHVFLKSSSFSTLSFIKCKNLQHFFLVILTLGKQKILKGVSKIITFVTTFLKHVLQFMSHKLPNFGFSLDDK